MCNVMVKRIDHTHPTLDAFVYKRGDAAAVIEDSQSFGSKLEAENGDSLDPQFSIFRLPGIPTQAFKHLMNPKTITTGGPGGDELTPTGRRQWKVDYDDMTPEELADFDTAPYVGQITVGRMQVLSKEK